MPTKRGCDCRADEKQYCHINTAHHAYGAYCVDNRGEVGDIKFVGAIEIEKMSYSFHSLPPTAHTDKGGKGYYRCNNGKGNANKDLTNCCNDFHMYYLSFFGTNIISYFNIFVNTFLESFLDV